MQYLPGGTLANRLAGGPLKLRIVAPIIEQIAAALDAAHARHIIHQDVKPANIIFNTDNRAFLSDFGIAWMSEAGSGTSGERYFGGTPAYMSPEQAYAILDKIPKNLDGRSDIYSLGAVFFRAITGQLPYHTGDPQATMRAHLTEPIPRVLDIEPRLPAACQEIVDRALAKDPADRYQTAQDLAQDVTDLAAGRWFLNKIAE
jgi:serine/threonine protein kinase